MVASQATLIADVSKKSELAYEKFSAGCPYTGTAIRRRGLKRARKQQNAVMPDLIRYPVVVEKLESSLPEKVLIREKSESCCRSGGLFIEGTRDRL